MLFESLLCIVPLMWNHGLAEERFFLYTLWSVNRCFANTGCGYHQYHHRRYWHKYWSYTISCSFSEILCAEKVASPCYRQSHFSPVSLLILEVCSSSAVPGEAPSVGTWCFPHPHCAVSLCCPECSKPLPSPALCRDPGGSPHQHPSLFHCTVDGGDLGARPLHQLIVEPGCSPCTAAPACFVQGPSGVGVCARLHRTPCAGLFEHSGVLPSNIRARLAPFGPQISGCEATCSCDNVLRIKRAEKNIFGDVIVMPWMDDKEQHAAPGYQAFTANSASDCLNVFLFHSACCASPHIQLPATSTTWNVKRERLFLQYL